VVDLGKEIEWRSYSSSKLAVVVVWGRRRSVLCYCVDPEREMK